MLTNQAQIQQAALAAQEFLNRGELTKAHPIVKELNLASPNNASVLNTLVAVQEVLLRQQQALPQLSGALHACMQNTVTALLLEMYHRFLLAANESAEIRWAVIGDGCGIWTLGEQTSEWPGFTAEHFELAGHGCYTVSRRPLEEIALSEFDAICVDGKDAAEEGEYVRRLALLQKEQNVTRPIFLAHKLSRGHFHALCAVDEFRSCLNPRKLAVMTLALAATSGGGRAFECGAYRCGTSVFAGALFTLWGDSRVFEAIDTFCGMPPARAEDGGTCYDAGSFQETTRADAQAYIERNNLAPMVWLHEGLAQDVLDKVLAPGDEIAFSLVDTDQYAGTLESLRRLLPRLKRNGLIIVDDYGVLGVRTAVDEVNTEFPALRRCELTSNFCILWNERDERLFSCAGDEGHRHCERSEAIPDRRS